MTVPNEADIARLRSKYRPLGIMKGSEFLLTPSDALRLVRDLEAIGAVIVLCDVWKYAERDKGWIVSLLGAGKGIGDRPYDGITAQQAAGIMERYLSDELPEDAELVSFWIRNGDLHGWFA